MKLNRLVAKIVNKVAQSSVAEVNDGLTSSADNIALCRRAAAESCVLLKNNGVLPIEKGNTVAVFGRCQLDYFFVGYGSGGDVKAPYRIAPIDGLKNVGITPEPYMEGLYKKWIQKNPPYDGFWGHWPRSYDEMPLTLQQVQLSRRVSDTAVVFVGRSSGEDRENVLKRGSWYLTRHEERMLELVTQCFSNVCVVINSGSLMDFSWVERYNVGAVLMAWQGGQESGNGLADVLCGNVCPCGKLPDTIAPIEDYLSFSAPSSQRKTIYSDDVYVGYRALETFSSLREKVLYPFGFGLSYTTFDYIVDNVNICEDKLIVDVSVENTGNVDGKAVVQLYLSVPQSKLAKPSRILVSFFKTKLLSPNAEQMQQVTIDLTLFASYDDKGAYGKRNCFVLEGGEYCLYVGGDVRSAKCLYRWTRNEKILGFTSSACAPLESFCRVTNSNGQIAYEKVDVQKNDIRARILENLPVAKNAKSGDVTFEEVLNGYSMETFVAQLGIDELETLSRGSLQGMNCSLGVAGNAGVFGGTSDRLCKKGVPTICTNDGPSGVRLQAHASLFPVGIALASTFDEDLVCQVGHALGKETIERGSNVLLAPGMNIHRNPLCGRNFEYFSEDPFLTGSIAVAYVKGVQSSGASAVPKHFACNNTELNRTHNDSVVSLRALREIYLKPFEMCVKQASPHFVMASYNKLNGVYNCYNYDLCTAILREEWGFEGCVMTDWWIVSDSSPLFDNLTDQAYRVRAGVDIFMPGTTRFGRYAGKSDRTLVDSYRKGGITLGEMQQTAARVLNACLRESKRKKEQNLKND